jgi:imidazolonepropionase-like amidohydrolase
MLTPATWVLTLALIAAVALAQPPGKLALVGGMLIDGYEAPPLHHAAVLVEGNKIVWVGRAADAKIPADATVIDTSGRVMMPGMVELHAHLSILGHGNYGPWFQWIDQQGREQMLSRVMAISARQLLMAGVTSAVDLGGRLKESLGVRDRVNRGEIPGPRLFMSGPWITRASDRPGTMNNQFGGITIASSAQAAQETEKLIAAGVDVIKAHSGLTREDYRAIVETAHKHDIRVHAHVYAEEDVRNALETGVDVLTHAGSAGTAALQPGADSRHRERGTPGRRDRDAPVLDLSRHGRLSGAAAGPAAQGGLRARHLG